MIFILKLNKQTKNTTKENHFSSTGIRLKLTLGGKGTEGVREREWRGYKERNIQSGYNYSLNGGD